MIELILPSDYLQYLDNLPDVRVIVNTILPLAPIYTYGTACWGIYKKKSSVGFSIDICATMVISSIWRILYYFIAPYEKALLYQSIVMIFIQCILLEVNLAYRSSTYNPDTLSDPTIIFEKLSNLKPLALVPALESDNIWMYSAKISKAYGTRCAQTLFVWAEFVLSLFDVQYRRPGLFWQWSLKQQYWRFLRLFSALFTLLTIIFRSSPAYRLFLGTAGLFMEALLPLPQIMIIYRLRSVANFKPILLVAWLCGDCLKLSYLFYGTDNVLTIFFLAAFAQMGLDLIVLYQYITLCESEEKGLPI